MFCLLLWCSFPIFFEQDSLLDLHFSGLVHSSLAKFPMQIQSCMVKRVWNANFRRQAVRDCARSGLLRWFFRFAVRMIRNKLHDTVIECELLVWVKHTCLVFLNNRDLVSNKNTLWWGVVNTTFHDCCRTTIWWFWITFGNLLQFAIENGPVESVDFPIKNGDPVIFHSYP